MSTFLHYVHCKDALLDCSAPGGERCESLTRVDEIHRGPVNSPHKWPVTRKMFPFGDVIMTLCKSHCAIIVHQSCAYWNTSEHIWRKWTCHDYRKFNGWIGNMKHPLKRKGKKKKKNKGSKATNKRIPHFDILKGLQQRTFGAYLWLSWCCYQYINMTMKHALGRISETINEPIHQILWRKRLFLYVNNSKEIMSHFCTCHDSSAVVTCANLWLDWIIRIKIKVKRMLARFFQLWTRQHFVKWMREKPGSHPGMECVSDGLVTCMRRVTVSLFR